MRSVRPTPRLAQLGWVAPLALVLLSAGVIHEAFEIIYLVPPLVAG